ncbi:hypothetical protein BDP27DRAFT_1232254, partial [Rhodocollybia butyracea]
KQDSQILLMHYLNRVHFDAPMTLLELELYHQMCNVIGRPGVLRLGVYLHYLHYRC